MHKTAEAEKYNIICFSNQLWDFTNWTNKRFVMSKLAQLGHNVVFVDPPLNFGFVFIRQIFRGFWNLKRLFTQRYKDFSGALVYTPINLTPFSKISSKHHIFDIRHITKKQLDPNRKTILWIYHVQIKELFEYIASIEHDFLVYDCVDNYAAFDQKDSFFSTIVSKSKINEQEKKLTQMADIVFASAPGLVEKLKGFNEDIHFTPNVGDYERFKDSKKFADQIPQDLAEIPRPRIGYVGALDSYKFDTELVKKAAQDNPSFSFVIIGQRALKDKNMDKATLGLEELSNVYFLGPRPYEQKKYYLAGFDIDLIPYVLNDYTVGGCFPVKFHDSLAAGLPVVVTDLPAYLPFKDVCYISKTSQEFSDSIELALKEDSPEKIKQRQAVAKENNWDGKVTKMLDLIKISL